MPRLDVARGDESIVVRLSAQGLRQEDLRVEFFDGVMMLSGMCPIEEEGKSERWETFFYNISLPAGVTCGNAQIEFLEGRLEVRIFSRQSSGQEAMEAA